MGRHLYRTAETGALAQEHERLLAQRRHADARAPRERMVGRDDEDELVPEQQLAAQPGGKALLGRDVRHVELVGEHRQEHRLRDLLDDPDVDRRVERVEGGERGREIVGLQPLDRADRQAATYEAPQLGELGETGIELAEGALRALQQQASGFGQLDRARRARQQAHPELCLETAHVLGDRRLSDVKLGGGAGEVTMTRHRGERAELLEIHPDSSDYMMSLISLPSLAYVCGPCILCAAPRSTPHPRTETRSDPERVSVVPGRTGRHGGRGFGCRTGRSPRPRPLRRRGTRRAAVLLAASGAAVGPPAERSSFPQWPANSSISGRP